MIPPPRLGVVYTPSLDPAAMLGVARAADRAGLDEFWLWEDCFSNGGVSASAAVLGATESIHVGLGLMPVPLRNVALTAMETATLHRMFPGRFLAGVGHGVQPWMGQVGARAASPMTLLDEYWTALRGLLDGDEVTTAGRYVTLDAVRLQWPTETREPLFAGGTGPRTLRWAATHADGTLLAAALTDAELTAACTEIDGARAELHGAHDIIAPRLVASGPTADDRLRRETARWKKDSVADVAVSGDAQSVADEVSRLGRMGITSVIAHPTGDEPDLEGLVRFLGEQVRPLLR